LTDAGGGLAYEAGRAEERERIEEAVVSIWEWYAARDRDGGQDAFVREQSFRNVLSRIGKETLSDLLPPAAARLEADRQRQRAATCREALKTIFDDQMKYAGHGLVSETARKALEATA